MFFSKTILFKRPPIHHHYFIKSFATFAFSNNKNYYLTLGIPRTASQTEIKDAYYKLAKQHHPDIAKGNAERFKEINEAYEILSDTQKKTEYDSSLRNDQSYYHSQRSNNQTGNRYSQYQNDSQGFGTEYKRYSNFNQHYDEFYSRYKRESREDFDYSGGTQDRKHYEKEQQERMRNFDKDFDSQLEGVIQVLRKRLITFAVAFVGFLVVFKVGFGSQKRQTQVIYDDKTNNIYSTDEKTFREWMKNPNREKYPFHTDPRFIKQNKTEVKLDPNDLPNLQTNKMVSNRV